MSDRSPNRGRAVRGEWVPPPLDFAPTALSLRRTFTPREWRLLQLGSKTEDMDDKWYIFEEHGWIYFIRSWTGRLLYKARFDVDAHGASVAEALVHVPAADLTPARLEFHAKLVEWLIDYFLLGDDTAESPPFVD